VALGSNAAPAVPSLIEMYDSHPDPFIRQHVCSVLGLIGPPAEQAVPMPRQPISARW